MADKQFTEAQYLAVLTLIDKAAKNPDGDGDMPKEVLSLAARVLSNLERLTIAQEVIAGIRNKDMLT